MNDWKLRTDEELMQALRPTPLQESIPVGVLIFSAVWLVGMTFYSAWTLAADNKPLGPLGQSALVVGGLLGLGLSAGLALLLSKAAALFLEPKQPAPPWTELTHRHGQGGFEFDLQESQKLFSQKDNLSSVFLISGRENDFCVTARLEFTKDAKAFIECQSGPLLKYQPQADDVKAIVKAREEVPAELVEELHKLVLESAGNKKRKRRHKRAQSDGTLEVQAAWIRGKDIYYFGWLFLGNASEKEAWETLHDLALHVLHAVASTQSSLLRESVEKALLKRGFFFRADSVLQYAIGAASAVPSKNPQAKSWVGGAPKVPASFQWPKRNNQPLSFVAQVACDEALLLGRTGTLAFFVDPGCYRLFPKEKNHCQVVFFPAKENEALQTVSMANTRTYTWMPIEFSESMSLAEKIPATLPEKQHEAYKALRKDMRPMLQTLGHAHPEHRLELEEKDICHKTYNQVPAQDWVLLLALHNASDVRFDASGELRFYIPKSDLANGDFQRVCAISAVSTR